LRGNTEKRTIIVGAGVAGLTLAYHLCRSGKEVLLVEKAPAVGGLARSFEYDGYVFDIGPHRFHTDVPEVMDFILEILEDDYLTIERKSGVWMFGRYFDWPLKAASVFRMPPHVLFSVGMDLLRRRKNDGDNFRDHITSRYGRTLYRIFFEPYTEKFLKTPPSEVSKDWAVTGIDRAVIDKRIMVDNIFKLAMSMVLTRPPLRFVYPGSGGIGVFSEVLSRKILESGGSLLVNSRIDEIVKNGEEVKEVVIGGQRYECGLLVWTGSVNEILQQLGHDKADLEYLSLLLYNYRVNHGPLIDYQWNYYGSGDIPFNRVSIPSLFNPLLAPDGRTGICVEVTCREGDPVWENPGAFEPVVRKSLSDVGILKDVKDVSGFDIERIGNAYPIYTVDYLEKFKRASEMLEGYKNVRLLGRTGTFWYNNMDHSIQAAIDLFSMLNGRPS
jgi:protoporphyrinogen oxidase